jgi:ABC-2 type transport system permease protein
VTLGKLPYTAASAESAVRSGDVPVAVVIPKGFGQTAFHFGPQDPSTPRVAVQILADSGDPVAPNLVAGLLQKAAMVGMPDVMAQTGSAYFEQYAGGFTPEQRVRIDAALEQIRANPNVTASGGADSGPSMSGVVPMTVRDILGEHKKNPMIAYFAAGMGVMFLLFSVSGAGGTLLDEAESGVLDRILSSRVSMTNLLLGKLLYLSTLGVAQLTVMFAWGAVVFKLELLQHLPGFFTMAIVTAVAAGALGLLLASICKTRAQLGALSTMVIMLMSSMGGSMFPRSMMPAAIQKVSLVTFNAWAVDGFQKVFWRDLPLYQLWPQVLVLVCAAVAFFLAARRVSRKWEIA